MAKEYTKDTWTDEVLAGAETYNISGTGAGQTIALDQTVSVAGTVVNASRMNNIENGIDALDTFLHATITSKTIATGVLTVDKSRHIVQPESGTTDDLVTISGMSVDSFLMLMAADDGTDTITIVHGSGNIKCASNADVTMSTGLVLFYYDGTTVFCLGQPRDSVFTAAVQTLTNKRLQKRVVIPTISATPTYNTDNGEVIKIGYTGAFLSVNITSMTTNKSGTPNMCDMISFEFLDDGTARTIAWGADFRSTDTGTLPTTTTASKLLRVLCQWDSVDSKWDCLAVAEEA